MKKNITIVGGGIAGLTTAIALNKAGFSTTIFEAAPEVKAVGAGLALAANAMKAFQKIGIAEDVIAEGRILPAFLLLDQQGKQLAKTNSEALSKKYGVDNFTIHRADLHRVLLSKLDPTTVHSNKRIVDIITQEEKTVLTFKMEVRMKRKCWWRLMVSTPRFEKNCCPNLKSVMPDTLVGEPLSIILNFKLRNRLKPGATKGVLV
jgi:2-polyprenyl-6-methoxyphenol hydroxylase-like FAD-dependent oxidoreductase